MYLGVFHVPEDWGKSGSKSKGLRFSSGTGIIPDEGLYGYCPFPKVVW